MITSVNVSLEVSGAWCVAVSGSGGVKMATHMVQLLVVPVWVVLVQADGDAVVFPHEQRVHYRQHLWGKKCVRWVRRRRTSRRRE